MTKRWDQIISQFCLWHIILIHIKVTLKFQFL